MSDSSKNKSTTNTSISLGIGNIIACVISYIKWKSILWALLHGLLGWIYVLYYLIKGY